MSLHFTYNAEQLSTSALYRARFALGDKGQMTDDAGSVIWHLSDEEINSLIAQYGYAEGVAQLAEGLAVQFAQEPDQYDDEGGVKVRWGDRIKAWLELARSLRQGASRDNSKIDSRQLLGTLSQPDVSGIRCS